MSESGFPTHDGRTRRILVRTAVVLVLAIAAALAVGVVMTSRPGFLGGYHDLSRRYDTLESSGHRGLTCTDCHAGAQTGVVRQLALVGDFYRGLMKKPDSPLFVKIGEPTNDACLACHRYDWSMDASQTAGVPHPAHLRVANETRDCVDCHKWTAHEETYQDKHKTMPFSAVCASFPCHSGVKPMTACGDCHHAVLTDQAAWKASHPKTVQAVGPNGCLESCHDANQCRMCHATGKTPEFASSPYPAGVQLIEKEHVKADWLEQHGTYALQDAARCKVCHVSEGECEDCHAIRPAFHDPQSTWLARHKDLAKDERRCLTCHEKKWCDDCHAKFKEMK